MAGRAWFAAAFGAGVVALAAAGAARGAEVAADFVVAPGGDDGYPGTVDRPFATPARARDAVRHRIAAGLAADVTVMFRGGTYRVAEPIVFGPADGGTEKFGITYAAWPGEDVVVSGGLKITGWKQGSDGTWTAALGGAGRLGGPVRQLYVNGRRAVRARTPNLDDEVRCWYLLGSEFSTEDRRFPKTFKLMLPKGAVRPWRDGGDVEIVVFKDWATLRKGVEGVDEATGAVTLRGPHTVGKGTRSNGLMGDRVRRYTAYLEGAVEMLDRPGEWAADRRSGWLHYRPRAGEDMPTAEVVVPVARQVLVIRGEQGRPVRNLHFRRLRFAHSRFDLVGQGHDGRQACFFYNAWGVPEDEEYMTAAVEWWFAEGCSLTDAEVACAGGTGVGWFKGCRRNVLRGCRVADTGGNAVMVGVIRDGPEQVGRVPRGNRVENNLVESCGREYPSAVGIWLGFAAETVVAHNEVRDSGYTGISVGWQWNAAPSGSRDNRIEHNHVHDVMKQLGDGGAIYTLGFQPGSAIRGNLLHDVRRSEHNHAAPNNGIFFDEGSKGYLVEGNVIHGTVHAPMRFHRCGEIVLRDNVLALPEGMPPYRYNATKPEVILKEGDKTFPAGQAPPDLARRIEKARGAAGLEPTYRRLLSAPR